jgi:Protein of unknown function (DUF2946)
MHWLRSNRFGSWCALFALALQLGLSFGHVHRGGPVGSFAFSVLAVAATDQSAAAMPAGGPELPKPGDLGYCGVCTTIALAGTLVPPATPELPLPDVVTGIRHWASTDFRSTPLRHFIFSARAPPQA